MKPTEKARELVESMKLNFPRLFPLSKDLEDLLVFAYLTGYGDRNKEAIEALQLLAQARNL
jgi:hypothetical protein